MWSVLPKLYLVVNIAETYPICSTDLMDVIMENGNVVGCPVVQRDQIADIAGDFRSNKDILKTGEVAGSWEEAKKCPRISAFWSEAKLCEGVVEVRP